VTVEPASVTFEAGEGQNLLDAALKAGLKWPTVCKGVGNCKTCYFLIVSGAENFSPITPLEKNELVYARRRHPDVPEDHVRLGCQTTVTGDVVVHCKGARIPAPPSPSPTTP
jgi:2Fe-2S ferredoxin